MAFIRGFEKIAVSTEWLINKAVLATQKRPRKAESTKARLGATEKSQNLLADLREEGADKTRYRKLHRSQAKKLKTAIQLAKKAIR